MPCVTHVNSVGAIYAVVSFTVRCIKEKNVIVQATPTVEQKRYGLLKIAMPGYCIQIMPATTKSYFWIYSVISMMFTHGGY